MADSSKRGRRRRTGIALVVVLVAAVFLDMALLVTEDRSGRMATTEENSPVGANALRTLRLLQDDALAPFRGPDFDAAGSQAVIEAYFSAIRCKSGKSNRACARESGGKPSAETAPKP